MSSRIKCACIVETQVSTSLMNRLRQFVTYTTRLFTFLRYAVCFLYNETLLLISFTHFQIFNFHSVVPFWQFSRADCSQCLPLMSDKRTIRHLLHNNFQYCQCHKQLRAQTVSLQQLNVLLYTWNC